MMVKFPRKIKKKIKQRIKADLEKKEGYKVRIKLIDADLKNIRFTFCSQKYLKK
jgi:hypothetical protein